MVSRSDKPRILVVDDATDTLEVLDRNLSSRGYTVIKAHSVGEATHILGKTNIELVITDYKMPQVDGLDLVQYVNDNFADTEVIMITGYPSIGGAVKAVRLGASDYLEKPFTDDELFGAVERALERQKDRLVATREEVQRFSEPYGLIGESPAMNEVFRAIGRAASTMATIVITGESGTGKELVARAIHYQSDRAAAPFVPVNCGGIPEGLLESELFGHVKGAFTGATRLRTGFFQAADGGTLFLDEISETSSGMQVKLLRVLQDRQICLVGDNRPREVDVRILAATNKNLDKLVKKNVFREDLYFRLSVVTIHVPPLRDRDNDIVLLANAFARKYARVLDREPVTFSEGALRILKNYSWPGNVRELENVVHNVMIMSDRDQVEASDLPSLMKGELPRSSVVLRPLAEVELEHIRDVLNHVDGNKSQASQILGIDRKTLRQKLQSASGSKDKE
jgi:DNA-binding NtrC family response regulator